MRRVEREVEEERQRLLKTSRDEAQRTLALFGELAAAACERSSTMDQAIADTVCLAMESIRERQRLRSLATVHCTSTSHLPE